jgi:hypothetical protein
MLIIILFFLSETKETGEFLFSIKKEEDLIKFSLNFKNLYKFDIEDYREILTFTKDACIDSKGIFNFEKNENSELKLEFMFTQDEGNKVLKL